VWTSHTAVAGVVFVDDRKNPRVFIASFAKGSRIVAFHEGTERSPGIDHAVLVPGGEGEGWVVGIAHPETVTLAIPLVVALAGMTSGLVMDGRDAHEITVPIVADPLVIGRHEGFRKVRGGNQVFPAA